MPIALALCVGANTIAHAQSSLVELGVDVGSSGPQLCQGNHSATRGTASTSCFVAWSYGPGGQPVLDSDPDYDPDQRIVHFAEATAEFGRLAVLASTLIAHDEDNQSTSAFAQFADSVTFRHDDFDANDDGSVTLHWRATGRSAIGRFGEANLNPNASCDGRFRGRVTIDGQQIDIGEALISDTTFDQPTGFLSGTFLTDEVVSWTVPDFVWDEPVDVFFSVEIDGWADLLAQANCMFDETFELVGMEFVDGAGQPIPLEDVTVDAASTFDYVPEPGFALSLCAGLAWTGALGRRVRAARSDRSEHR